MSLATVRLTNPTARIEVACDQQTHQALQASGSKLFCEAENTVCLPNVTSAHRLLPSSIQTLIGFNHIGAAMRIQ